jgi:hypothetical protein
MNAKKTQIDEFDEHVLLKYSHRPHYILKRLIPVNEADALAASQIKREHGSSSLGSLDDLPRELIDEILCQMDLQSLARLSKACLRGKKVVDELPAYNQIVSSASHIFATLTRVQVIGLHSVAKLHATLRSESCISCGQFGACLILLSCERCCHACLTYNQSLWMITAERARSCFGLTEEQSLSLPYMRSVSGPYPYRGINANLSPTLLTSVRAAKLLANKVRSGVGEALIGEVATLGLGPLDKRIIEANWLRRAPLEPLRYDPLVLSTRNRDMPLNPWRGMGAIYFPQLTVSGSLENGLWCKGCTVASWSCPLSLIDEENIPPGVVPDDCARQPFLRGLEYRARTTAGFIEHAQLCPWANDEEIGKFAQHVPEPFSACKEPCPLCK